jgi:hypothetical protein
MVFLFSGGCSHPFESRGRTLGGLFLPGSIFKDHLVNNLSAVDASPTEEMFLRAIKFFKSHDTVATGTFHLSLL